MNTTCSICIKSNGRSLPVICKKIKVRIIYSG
uniref:Uncharacterized protein n=1 Tax=Siphoviridae sp. ctqwO1 TaxID=2826472 RepID=A0A8S5QNW1_9CAUD|nr:MAG TPA: hypothetical protein [Siphoviridae sp. ctqwO1]